MTKVKNYPKPSPADAQRSIAIRCASKRGQYTSLEDYKWNRKIFEKYGKWYASTERDIFEMTKPFGSR